MNYRQRIRAALRGQPVDFVPFAPRWEMLFEAATLDGRLPEKYRGWDIFDVTRDLGMGIKGYRGSVHRLVMTGVETRQRQDGIDTITEYDTPYGTVRMLFRRTAELQEEGVRGLEMEYLIKGKKDYDPVYYMLDHTKVVPAYDDFLEYDRKIGNDGLGVVHVGPCPFHKIQREYTGYQQSYFELIDNLPQFEKLAEMLQAQFDQIVKVAAESPAEAIEVDGNYDISLHPPALFEEWFLQPLKRCGDTLHSGGKLFVSHCDGQMRNLLEPVKRTGMDVAEAWSPYPQTTVTTAEARAVWGDQVAIWGGLPTPILREATPPDVCERHFHQFLREIAPGTKVVIGSGDNFPTDSSFERVKLVVRLVEQYCKYPLDVTRLPAG